MPDASANQKKRPGPAPRGPFTGKRKTLTTRITEGMRNQLEAAAKANDRSLSQDIEFRLEQSFLIERGAVDVRNAVLQGVYESFGGEDKYRLLQPLALIAYHSIGADWNTTVSGRRQAYAAMAVLNEMIAGEATKDMADMNPFLPDPEEGTPGGDLAIAKKKLIDWLALTLKVEIPPVDEGTV